MNGTDAARDRRRAGPGRAETDPDPGPLDPAGDLVLLLGHPRLDQRHAVGQRQRHPAVPAVGDEGRDVGKDHVVRDEAGHDHVARQMAAERAVDVTRLPLSGRDDHGDVLVGEAADGRHQQLGDVGTQRALADQHHRSRRLGDLVPPGRRLPARRWVRTQRADPVHLLRHVLVRVLERRRAGLQVEIGRDHRVHDVMGGRRQTEVGPDLGVAPVGRTEDHPTADRADDGVARDPQWTAHRPEAGSERRRLRARRRKRTVAERRPHRAAELVEETGREGQSVGEHRVDRPAGNDLLQVGDPLRRATHEDLGEHPPQRGDGGRLSQPGELVLEDGAAEVVGPLVGKDRRSRGCELVLVGGRGVPEHLVPPVHEAPGDREWVGRMRQHRDAGDEERAHAVRPFVCRVRARVRSG